VSGEAGLRYALRRVHAAETELADQLTHLAERHASEHEVQHVARDLRGWSQTNLSRIDEAAANHQADLRESRDSDYQVPAALAGQKAPTGVQLLDDLCTTYLMAADASLAWELLAQYGKSQRQTDILALVDECHPRILRQMRWANTMLKTASPQVLRSL